MTVEGALHAWIDADLNVQIEDEAYWASFGKIAAEANSAAGRRDAWLDACVAEVRACIAGGIAVHSYLYWSLLDNFEWTQGYSQRFGLVAVDRATFRRTAKPSAAHFAGIIQTAKTCSS